MPGIYCKCKQRLLVLSLSGPGKAPLFARLHLNNLAIVYRHFERAISDLCQHSPDLLKDLLLLCCQFDFLLGHIILPIDNRRAIQPAMAPC